VPKGVTAGYWDTGRTTPYVPKVITAGYKDTDCPKVVNAMAKVVPAGYRDTGRTTP